MKEADSGEETVRWHCVRAKPRCEATATAHLATLEGVEVFLPRTQRQRKTQEASEKTMRPLFPGYIFVRFDPEVHLQAVHYSRGVAYVVRRKQRPVPVPDEVIRELRRFVRDGVVELADKPHAVGDHVTIIAGLFHGAKGKVIRLVPARERVKILFEILGRETEVEIPEESLDFPSTHPLGVGS